MFEFVTAVKVSVVGIDPIGKEVKINEKSLLMSISLTNYAKAYLIYTDVVYRRNPLVVRILASFSQVIRR